ncbi:unnamed protein product [Rotaria sp. Silwood2]|nr:unnamed protein product [Rotaria sp. Silwood2]
MGFYSSSSEISASDRISGCKYYGSIPTSKDTMTYHLEISSHLSFVGATTGRLWHRLINYYAQGHQSSGKTKIVAPIKNSIINTIKSLGISEDQSAIMDDFTTASLSAKLAKSNVFIVTDEAEKPLLEMGLYSPSSEISASDRISGYKYYGSMPTSTDPMTYHLEISCHLSFVGATIGRLWHRLINYYAQGHQSNGLSERSVFLFCNHIHYFLLRPVNLHES